MIHLVPVQPVEYIAAHRQPRSVRIVVVDELVPRPHRQPEAGLLLPGDRRHLEVASIALIEYAAAEEKREGDITFAYAVEVLGGRDVEVEGAWNLDINTRRVGERWERDTGVGPHHGTERVTPPVRLAEQVAKPRLLVGVIVPPGDIQLYLASQERGVNLLGRGTVGHLKGKGQKRRGREGHHAS